MKLDGTGNENHEKLPKNAKEEDHAEYIPIKKRRMLEAQKILLRKGKGSLLQDAEQDGVLTESKPSLLVKASQLKKDFPEISPMEQIVQ